MTAVPVAQRMTADEFLAPTPQLPSFALALDELFELDCARAG